MTKDDLLYANPANYVVDVIGAGEPGLGAAGYRQLSQDELTLLANCRECTHALNSTPSQNPSPLNAYNCMGLQFMRVMRGNASYTYVWNHPAPIVVTGLKGIPSMSTTPHLEPAGVGAYHPNPWRQLSVSEITLLHQYCPQFKTQFTTVRPQIVNGAQVWHLTCGGYAIMVQASTSGTFWYVYNHPGQLVFNMKQYERPAVPARGGIPVPYSLHGVPHWLGVGDSDLGTPNNDMGVGDAATDQQNADAVAMNNSLNDHGYKLADQYLYKAFQKDVGLNPDGYPGTKTMQELKDVLFALGVEMANVPVYPWLASGGYDGVNAPLMSDWNPGASATPATPSGGGTYTAPVTTVPGGAPKSNAAVLLIGGAVAAVAGGAGIYYWRKRHARR